MRILREPLVHFLVIGMLVYVAAGHRESVRLEIDAGPEQRARLARTYFEQYGVLPTSLQLEQAIDDYVRNEILYREGLAMGLDRDDEIVRRRVVQKIEFVNEDLEAAGALDPAGIARYFAYHRDRYDSEPAASFEHVFFSSDRGGEADARRRAAAFLGGADARPVGDSFAEGRVFRSLTHSAASSLFGDTELSAALFTGPVGQWAGPFRSAYGWHVVKVTDRQPARHVELEAVRAKVEADYRADLRERANAEAYRRVAGKYRIVTDGARTGLAGPTATPPAIGSPRA